MHAWTSGLKVRGSFCGSATRTGRWWSIISVSISSSLSCGRTCRPSSRNSLAQSGSSLK